MKYFYKTLSVFLLFLFFSSNLYSAENNTKLLENNWTFKGLFGKFDRASLQRGYQVYNEVCASCHSIKYLTYRNLAEEGGPEFTEEEAKAIAANFEVIDGINVYRLGNDWTFTLLCFLNLRKWINLHKPDIVIEDLNKLPFYSPIVYKGPLLIQMHHLWGRSIFKETSLRFI